MTRELTKLHEEVVRGRLSELAERFRTGVKGEVTLVIEGGMSGAPEASATDSAVPVDLDVQIQTLLREGLHTREIADRIAKPHGLSSREAYRRVLAVSPREE